MGTAAAGADPLIGQVLASRYEIEVRIGEGAMGAVYRARHVKVGRPFAVKILHPKLLEEPKIAQRFEREAELAGRLRHPNVIGVVDVGETADGMRYMVMDFAAGDDLATLLSEAPMPAARVIALARQILEGLYHAHEAGLIHRDLKPENVIVERDDHGNEVPRLVDFGISILRDGGDSASSSGRLTTNGLVLGTPHYMAPEQAVADPIDHRIDLFALGIVIYELLSGKLPFDGTGAEVARANLLLEPPPISERVPFLEVDPLLEAFARLLMSKQRERRPATAKAARELLDLIAHDRAAASVVLGVRSQAVVEDTPGIPTEASAPLPSAVPGRRRALVIAVGVAVVAAAVILALVLGGETPRPTISLTADPPVEITPPPAEPSPVPAPTAPAIVEVGSGSADEAAPVAPGKHPRPRKPASAGSAAIAKTAVPPTEEPAAPTAPTKASISARYARVGTQISQLEQTEGMSAISAMRTKFRRINLQEWKRSPEGLREAERILAELENAIGKRRP